MSPLAPGQALGGFQIIEKIGRGAMGTVYRARQLALERDVALKVLDAPDDPRAFERFHQEAIRVAQLKHPNILPVFDFGRQDDVMYIAMELADGGTLAAQIGQPMAPARAIQTLKPAALAIDYAHAANIVHRDVKPANLLFDASGRLFLTDFGLALMRDAQSSTWGQMAGTPWYMAPEQFRGKAEPASDIYALAVTLFQMLTGRVPYERENPLAVALAHLREPIPSARDVNPAVTEPVDRALKRGLAKNPAERFGKAIELLAAILDALRQPAAGQPAAPSPAAPAQRSAAPAAASTAAPGAPGSVRLPSPAAAGPGSIRAPAPAAASQPASQAAAMPSPGARGRPAPAPGRLLFESKATPEWARANIMLRDPRSGKLAVAEGVMEVTLGPSNQAQMMLPVGLLQDVWAELQFVAASDSGTFDLLWHEGTSTSSYCVRVDPLQRRLSMGVVPSSGSGGERWLAARGLALAPDSQHTLLVVSSKGAIGVYLDQVEALAVHDSTLSQGMVRLRLLPAPQLQQSRLRLKRIAAYRPPA